MFGNISWWELVAAFFMADGIYDVMKFGYKKFRERGR